MKQQNSSIRPLLLLFLFLYSFSTVLKAQSVTENQLKASLVFNFLKSVDWPKEATIDTFRIEIFGDDPEIIGLLEKMQMLKVKDKPIRVEVCTAIDKIGNPNILYVTSSKNYFVKDIHNLFTGKHVLVITDHYQYQRYIMINFVTAQNGKLQFEINTKNLEESDFKSSPKLVLLGGTEIDVRKLFQETEQSLISEMEKASNYAKELEQRKQEINHANTRLSQLNKQLQEEHVRIQAQKNELEVLTAQTETQQQKLNEKNLVLEAQQNEIKRKERLLDREQRELLLKQAQIEKYGQILKGQEEEIKKRQVVIDNQGNTLSSQMNIIKTQKTYLYFLSALIVLIIFLSVIALRSFILLRRNNRLLELTNNELKGKNLEIRAQAKELEEKNNLLEQINYELNLSRSEILEQKEELSVTLSKLTDAQQQLIQSEKMASLGVLVAGIAHEINNPVNFISTGVTGIEKVIQKLLLFLTELDKIQSGSADPSIRKLTELRDQLKLQASLELIPEVITNIKMGIERTIAIISGLRLYSYVDRDEKSMHLINDIIETSLLLIKPQIKGYIEIRKDYQAVSPCFVHPGKIGQVIINLLSNAIDAISEKTSPGSAIISIRTWETDAFVKAEFNDTGNGIPPEKIDKIFDPFFTTKKIGKGTGLGLSISLGIINEHNGHITASNNKDGGATIKIEIPKNNE